MDVYVSMCVFIFSYDKKQCCLVVIVVVFSINCTSSSIQPTSTTIGANIVNQEGCEHLRYLQGFLCHLIPNSCSHLGLFHCTDFSQIQCS